MVRDRQGGGISRMLGRDDGFKGCTTRPGKPASPLDLATLAQREALVPCVAGPVRRRGDISTLRLPQLLYVIMSFIGYMEVPLRVGCYAPAHRDAARLVPFG